MHLRLESTSEDQTIAIGRALGAMLRQGDILALDGELGAGKTRLVRGIAGGLGLDESLVHSPTYVIVNEYQAPANLQPHSPSPALRHVDAYRLGGPDDLDSLGWERVIDGRGIVVVEWAERIALGRADQPPAGGDKHNPSEPNLAHLRIEVLDGDRRALHLRAPAAWSQRSGWGRVLRAAGLGEDQLPPGWARCPASGRAVAPDNPAFPFANARARMADLGRWFSGGYTISRDLAAEDLTDPDLAPD